MNFAPSLLRVFLTALGPGRCKSLRRVLCRRAELFPELAGRARQCFPGVELYSLYGSAETAIAVAAWRCLPDSGRAILGKAIDNTYLYILDPRGEPTPIGVPGELCIGGVQVGRGYLNRSRGARSGLSGTRSARTRRRECTGPAIWRAGCRAVRSSFWIGWSPRSDCAAPAPRSDGSRPRCASTRTCATPLVLDTQHPPLLVAYYVPGGGSDQAPPSQDELLVHLRRTLPATMVPALLLPLSSLPLLPDGELDCSALPPPDSSGILSPPGSESAWAPRRGHCFDLGGAACSTHGGPSRRLLRAGRTSGSGRAAACAAAGAARR